MAAKRAAKVAIKRVGKVTVVSGAIPPGASLPRTLHKGDYVVFPSTSSKSGKLVRRVFRSKTANAIVTEIPMIWEKGVPYLIKVGRPGIWIEIYNGDDDIHYYDKVVMQ